MCVLKQSEAPLFLDDRDGASPTSRSAANLHWKTGDSEAIGREAFQVVKLFQMAVANMATGFVSFPDQRGVWVTLNFSAV